MKTDTLAAGRATAAQLLANLDDVAAREPLVIEMLEQFEDSDTGGRLQSLGAALAFVLDAIATLAEKHPAARDTIAAEIAALATPLNRTQRRALERDNRRGR